MLYLPFYLVTWCMKTFPKVLLFPPMCFFRKVDLKAALKILDEVTGASLTMFIFNINFSVIA